jgi:hypothetical protein
MIVSSLKQMGIVLHQDPMGTTTGDAKVPQRVRKIRYTTADLPFSGPPNNQNMQIWHNKFITSLLTWASMQADPFGTNAMITSPVINFWSSAFPDSLLDEQGLEIVLGVVCTSIRQDIYY